HDSYSLADQQARVQAGFQMLQSDYAWLQYRDSGPGMPMRPLDDKTFSDWTQFREPGPKIALNRIPAGSGMAFLSLVDNTGATDWETIPATTRPSPDNTYANSHWTRGKGCLRAEANDGSGDYFSVCRQTIDGHWYDPDHLGEMARITVESSRDGRRSYRDFYSGDNHSNGIGDQIRMQVSRSPGSTQTCATPYTASELAAPSTPAWSNLGAMCFRRGLPIQGVTAQYGDVLFVGTKKSGISGYLPVSALKAPDAFATGYLLQDQSYFPVAARQMVRSLLTLFRLKR
ncbi:MAG: hypothetical protein ACXWP5_14460, partial [Bdellovibrionota bacterium]